MLSRLGKITLGYAYAQIGLRHGALIGPRALGHPSKHPKQYGRDSEKPQRHCV